GKPMEIDAQSLNDAGLDQLVRNGFLVRSGTDEVAEIRERYLRARRDAPICIELVTTMDCNLGCYYCYEERTGDKLRITDVEGILRLVRDRFERSRKDRLHLDWFGGEPLLNIDFMNAASRAIQDYCAANGIRFTASVASNGTCWPADVGQFVEQHKLREVQISFDGLEDKHNRRRRYRDEFKYQEQTFGDSFA